MYDTMFFYKKTKIILVLMIYFSLVGCKKKAQQSNNNNVPYTPINITIYPNDPLNFKIQTPGGWIYYSGGVSGLIVYRNTSTDFVILDRTSTFDPNNFDARVKVQSDSFTCKDTLSGSKWQIINGAVMNGPATYPLKLYGNTFDGTTLKIFN